MKARLLNLFYVTFTGLVFGSVMYGSLVAGVSRLHH